MRAAEYAFFLGFSYYKYKKALTVDWRKKLEEVRTKTDLPPEEVIHLVILPTYKEPIDVLRESVSSIANSEFPKDQIFFCLATEERDHENGKKNAEILKEEFSDRFGKFYWSEHPDGLPNEVRGKGGNITFAGKLMTEKMGREEIDPRKVLVTTLDADNRLHPHLLSVLTYAFCKDKRRHHKAFQPLPLFFNNIWDVPTINRMVALSSGFWHMIESGRPDRLRNFSSHSQPLSALVDMNFWDTTTIVEDGRQYWRSYLHFNGNYDVVPVFLPIFQDAVLSETYFRSLRGQFHQLRRWAWGASDIAYFTQGIREKWRVLPLWKTIVQYFRLLEGHYMWATAAIFLSTVPLSIHFFHTFDAEFAESVFAKHFIVIISILFNIAIFGILISMILTFLVTPSPPKKHQRVYLLLQWLLFPITTIGFGCLPALFTQTRMAMGKKMEFNVTEKMVVNEKN